MVGQPAAEVLVVRAETAERQQHMDQHESEEHHRGDEECVPGEEGDREDANRLFWSERPRKPVGKSVRPRLENLRPRPLNPLVAARLERRTRDGDDLRVHEPGFTRSLPG